MDQKRDDLEGVLDTTIDELVNIGSGWLRSGAAAASSALSAVAEGMRTTSDALERLGKSLEDSAE
ncbi:MAG: hypothetical protein HRU01_16750 [Myxococcales bacterium]|nr:hypothetical protein [Myxococcales bacterium]